MINDFDWISNQIRLWACEYHQNVDGDDGTDRGRDPWSGDSNRLASSVSRAISLVISWSLERDDGRRVAAERGAKSGCR